MTAWRRAGRTVAGPALGPQAIMVQSERDRSPLRDRAAFGALPPDLYVVPSPWPRLGRPVKYDVKSWRVVDDWPACVPVKDAEVDVFEAWFGHLFNELFGPSR